ncbi:hypothetical protein KC319_g9145, partial [Hortaea werneckii]
MIWVGRQVVFPYHASHTVQTLGWWLTTLVTADLGHLIPPFALQATKARGTSECSRCCDNFIISIDVLRNRVRVADISWCCWPQDQVLKTLSAVQAVLDVSFGPYQRQFADTLMRFADMLLVYGLVACWYAGKDKEWVSDELESEQGEFRVGPRNLPLQAADLSKKITKLIHVSTGLHFRSRRKELFLLANTAQHTQRTAKPTLDAEFDIGV